MSVPKNHAEAAAKTRIAQANLDALAAQKRQAALQDPGANDARYREKAAGKNWQGFNAFDEGVKRTT